MTFVGPDSAAGQRHHRSRMRLDHQQYRSPEKQVAFTNTHFLTATRYVSKKSSKLNSIDDLKGQAGGPRPPAPPISSSSPKPMPRATSASTSSPPRNMPNRSCWSRPTAPWRRCWTISCWRAFVAGAKDPDAYVISTDAFSKPEPYGIMLRKDDPAFKKVVDDATAALYQSAEGARSSTTNGSCRRSRQRD